MKTRTLKLAGIITVCLLMVMTLVSCKYSKSYADKINKAYEDGKPYTAEQVENKMGTPTMDLSGVKTWVKGYTGEEFMNLSEEDLKTKKFKVMTVYFFNNKAVAALYLSGNEEEINEQTEKWKSDMRKKLDGLFS